MTIDEKEAVRSAQIGTLRIEAICDMLARACAADNAETEAAFECVSALASCLGQQLAAIAQ